MVTPGSGLTHGNAFSARWSGYVLPEYTDTYTFDVDDDEARLWIDGKQILPGVGTVALKAGVYTPIRLEYRHGTGSASHLVLQWSRTSAPVSDLVPTNCLASVPQETMFRQDCRRRARSRTGLGLEPQPGVRQPKRVFPIPGP